CRRAPRGRAARPRRAGPGVRQPPLTPAEDRTTVSDTPPPGRRRRRPRDPQATMPLVGHLTELRNRIAKALLALALGTVVGFLWYDHGLLTFLTEPYCELPSSFRFQGDEECRLVVLDVFGGVLLRLKIGLI